MRSLLIALLLVLSCTQPTTRTERPAQPEPAEEENCHPSYEGVCLDPNESDYDCNTSTEGPQGDGPGFVDEPVDVVGEDEYDLDGDGNGVGCEYYDPEEFE